MIPCSNCGRVHPALVTECFDDFLKRLPGEQQSGFFDGELGSWTDRQPVPYPKREKQPKIIGTVRGTESEQEHLKRQARLAGTTLANWMREKLGLTYQAYQNK